MSNLGNQELGDIILGASFEEEVSSYYAHGQAQAWVEATYNQHGQAQSQIKQTYYAHGQSQAQIKQTYYVHGQANAATANTYFVHGQANAYILGIPQQVAQAQAQILQVYYGLGQAQALIPGSLRVCAQAQGLITRTLLLDTFTRTTSLGTIGTPDIGPTWTYLYDSVDDLMYARVKNGKLYSIDPDFDSFFMFAHSTIRASNIDIWLEFDIDVSNSFSFELDARLVSGDPLIYVYKATGLNWGLHTPSGTTEQAALQIVPNTTYKIHLQVEDTTARFNIWQADQPEPSTWLITRTGVVAGQSGSVAVGASAGFPYGTIRFDNVSVTAFETSTIQQKMVANAQAFIHVPYGAGQALAAISPLPKTGQAQAEISSVMPPYFQFLDTFTREIEPVDGALSIVNPPDIGMYTEFQASDGGFSYNGRLELWNNTFGDYAFFETLLDSDNVLAWGDFYQDVYVNNASFGLYIDEGIGATEYYWVYVAKNFELDGTTRLYIETNVDNFNVIVPNLVNGAPYRIMLYSAGSNFKAKVWNLNEAEPSGWTTEFTSNIFHKDYIFFEYDFRSATGTQWVDNLTVKIDEAPVAQSYGQARAFIYSPTVSSCGQARAQIKATLRRHGQARARIKGIGINRHGQARAFIRRSVAYGQARARIKASKSRSGQALALINSIVKQQFGQAQAFVDSTIHVQSAQANALITNPSYYLVDTFTRTLSGSLGTPDIGPTWTTQNNPDDLDGAVVDGEKVTVPYDGVNYEYIAALSPISLKNAEMLADIYFNASPSDTAFFPYVEFDLRIGSPGIVYIWYQHTPNAWTLDSDNPDVLTGHVIGTFVLENQRWYKVRFIALGSWIRFKIWDAQEEEPPTWVIDATTPPVYEGVGGAGFWLDNGGSGAVGSGPVLDNLIVRQAATEVGGQAQAYIVGGLTLQYGQAGAFIFQSPVVHGQSNAYIKAEGVVKHGQTQAHIEAPFRYAQAQARLKIRLENVGQARAFVVNASRRYSQAQSLIKVGNTPKSGQSQAFINLPIKSGQARAFIDGINYLVLDTYSRNTPVNAIGTPDIGPAYWEYFNGFYNVADYDDSQVIDPTLVTTGTEEYAYIDAVVPVHARNVNIFIDFKLTSINDWATVIWIDSRVNITYSTSVNVNLYYDPTAGEMLAYFGFPPFTEVGTTTLLADTWYTARFDVQENDVKFKVWERDDPEPGTWLLEDTIPIGHQSLNYGGVGFYSDVGENIVNPTIIEHDNFRVIGTNSPYTTQNAQTRALIRKGTERNVHGQAQAFILLRYSGHGQSQSYIKGSPRRTAQAQAFISKSLGTGQAQALMAGTITYASGQALTLIVTTGHFGIGLCRATIIKPQPSGQAQARILGFGQNKSGNAQARILASVTRYGTGQARAKIHQDIATGQAAALIDSPVYLARYNGFDLPGYVQSESIDSIQEIIKDEVTYVDGTLSEYFGLRNKILSLRLKAVGNTYAEVKKDVQTATTIVRSNKTFTKLYVHYPDRYYLALTKRITTEKTVGESMRLLDYIVEFETKPWLLSDKVYTIEGTGTITTDDVGRTITNGGWSPVNVSLDGTNVTISGYTEDGQFAGYIAVSGSVTNLIINSEEYTATINGVNVNEVMFTPNYQLFVGPGKTTYVITGATRTEITYQDRWYL